MRHFHQIIPPSAVPPTGYVLLVLALALGILVATVTTVERLAIGVQ